MGWPSQRLLAISVLVLTVPLFMGCGDDSESPPGTGGTTSVGGTGSTGAAGASGGTSTAGHGGTAGTGGAGANDAKPPIPQGSIYLGSSTAARDANCQWISGSSTLDTYLAAEAQLADTAHPNGRYWAIDHQFTHWDNFDLSHEMYQNDKQVGRIPLINWKPTTSAGSIPWAAVADGSHDAEIDAAADQARDFDSPLFMTFHHEPFASSTAHPNPSGDVYGSPEEYRAAFRHVVERFRARGADNVAWVLVLTGWDYEVGRGDLFNPGDDIIDWLGADPYNMFLRDDIWRELADIIYKPGDNDPDNDFYSYGLLHQKPMMLAEWGSNEDPAVPGRKGDWFDNAAAAIEQDMPELKALAYFNQYHQDGAICNDWPIDTSTSSIERFRAMAYNPYFGAMLANQQ